MAQLKFIERYLMEHWDEGYDSVEASTEILSWKETFHMDMKEDTEKKEAEIHLVIKINSYI